MLNPELYTQALSDPDEDIRCEALNALLAKGMSAAVDLFEKAASDSSARVRATAINALGKLGNPGSMSVLLNAMDDVDGMVRAEAAYASAQYRDARANQLILQVLERATPMEKVIVLMGLASYPHMDFAEALQSALSDPAADIRHAAESVLARHVDFYHVRPLPDLTETEYGLEGWTSYERVFQKIMDEEPDSAGDLFITALTREYRSEERIRMLKTLVKLNGPGSLIALVHSGDDHDEKVRCVVVEELGRWDDPLAKEVIEKLLDDTSAQVRSEAAFAYARSKVSGMSHRLVRMLQVEKCSQVRETLLYLLAKHDFARAESFLHADLESTEKEIQLRAAVLLAEHRDNTARDILWTYLDDKEDWARALAIHGLGRLGDNDALLHLIDALQDEDPEVRAAAAGSLGRLGDNRALGPLRRALYDVYPAVRETVAESLARLEARHRSIAV